MEISSYRESLEKSAEIQRHRVSEYDEFMQVISENVKGRCLEIGCGDGLWIPMLKKLTDELVSVDLSRSRIRMARKISNHTKFVLCDARHLPFKNGSFDSICAFEVIEHLPGYSDHSIFLGEVIRVLKGKGIFLVSTPNRPIFRVYCKILKEEHSTHFSELSYYEFRSILEKRFASSRIYGQFGWLSPFYKCISVRMIHGLLSKLVPLCKGMLGVCRKSSKAG